MVQFLSPERPAIRPSRGEQTRDRILDVAEGSVLDKGFAATSIDEILFDAGITKSGFFYHFRDKNDLARALLQRFAQQDALVFDEIFARGDELHEDPLHAFLIGLTLLAETLAEVKARRPGCLVATFVYQDQQFDADIRRRVLEIMGGWRARFLERIEGIAVVYPPRIEIEPVVLADMLSAVVEGAILLSKAFGDPTVNARQVLAYRAFVRAVFLGA